VDEGLPIAYPLLEAGVPVTSKDGIRVGTVHHVVSAPEQDIFHGLVISTTAHGMRFVEGADIASLHEHGVDLRIDAAAAAILPQPGGAAPVYSEDPTTTKWSHWSHKLTGRKDWHKDR